MGNSWTCFAPKEVRFTREPSKRIPNFLRKSRTGSSSSPSPSRNKQENKLDDEDAQLRQQAIAAAILFRKNQQNLSLPLNRSTSVVYPNPSPGVLKKLPKSSSSRQRSRSDSLVQPHQLVINKDVKADGLETNHFVLVHGGGFGAWCW
ncbi:hypothetical protein I3843_06G086900 [Carya illinoinensis]|uniref:Uncharacterized protein n=1 Tax=Carya illinoinensis TaxID=32201 RepID=A0A8T1Q9X0_CARIL|nr:putative methylesterase 11, chloroplastic isoform X1 [Carya illinoinensis]KAG6651177.1 hypothetical protein CIPAW_06G092800 [Carya illinoinensis]KAG6708666.1 hypothetical protein I3842_06G093100 [Carya illinoinensis]KAG7975208.1 hypothetical protein I3843_06G086900 [Carya illinoinensis]